MITKTDITVEFKEEIGQEEGKNSRTFLAYDPQLDTDLVIKEFGYHELGIAPCTAMFDYYPFYFKEARMLNKSRHPNILPVIYAGFGEHLDGTTGRTLKTIRIATKYLEKGSFDAYLHDIYETGTSYPSLKTVLEYANQILQGLSHIHQQGIMHLDLKPTNILIEDNGDLLITDFGQSKFYNPSDTFIPDQYRHHLAPEVLQGQQPQFQTDIYHFGLTLYRICGYDLFHEQVTSYYNGDSFDETKFQTDILSANFPDRTKYHHYIPKTLRDIINRCLDTNPQSRFSTVSEILMEINTKVKDFDISQSINGDLMKVIQNDTHYELEILEINSNNYTINVYKKTSQQRPLKYSTTVRKPRLFNKIWQIVVSLRRGSLF